MKKILSTIFFYLPTDRLHQNGSPQMRHSKDQLTMALASSEAAQVGRISTGPSTIRKEVRWIGLNWSAPAVYQECTCSVGELEFLQSTVVTFCLV